MKGKFEAQRVLCSICEHANLTQKIGVVYYRSGANANSQSDPIPI
jgi:hypothetical protein